MPELPEVETLKRELARVLVGKKIKKIEGDFKLKLAGREIVGLERRAKILIFKLDSDYLLVHLKMTGQLVYGEVMGGHPEDPHKYTRATIFFTDNSKLLFNDLRKFGWLKLVRDKDLSKHIDHLGPEPLEKEFTLRKFEEILARYPNRKIKQLLLDQTLIAGLGNIYVDESCFLASILPTRLAGSLTKTEKQKLHHSIIAVLKLSISKKGTSARNYVRSNGEKGGMVPHLNVYGRGGKICKRCAASAEALAKEEQKIEKIKLGGRGTHFCPKCQK
jgi:formamidopyrimidine-DNA glycosylase